MRRQTLSGNHSGLRYGVAFSLSTHRTSVLNLEKHTTWLAYLWAFISGLFAQWTLNDYGAVIGIILGIGTFLVNRHYKQQSAQAQKDQVAAMEKRNQILEQLASRPDSSLKSLVLTAEEPEGDDGAKDES
ncbi:alpha/beta hydrolase [Salmonella enterica]|nr:alpha/beta hydrolase [Salmonella enterica]EEB0030303.1 alpha/beta hydrolase [Salmonella enterica subsp. enterica serovar Muenchen]EHT8065984.1 alpha/beta hydrolase [Salmonella enterica]EHT8864534.1 alpha/beta hydrolase [Salmonella enterica]EJT4776257.1 alpha/beta hydrolase [Salmonella enterica]